MYRKELDNLQIVENNYRYLLHIYRQKVDAFHDIFDGVEVK